MSTHPEGSKKDQEFDANSAKEAFARLVYKDPNTPTQSYRRYLEENYAPPERPGQAEIDEAINYDPFYAEVELRDIRKLSLEEQALPSSERRQIVHSRIEQLKSELEMQRAGIAETIQAVYERIMQTPDATMEELWQVVVDYAPQYKFNQLQLSNFRDAIEGYLNLHGAVEKYAAMYPDSRELFGACFGTLPWGKVDVVKGPMTLMFRCWDETDYAAIYNYGMKEVSNDQASIVGKTGGCALYACKIDELKGVITAENGKFLPKKREEMEREVEGTIHGEKLFSIASLKQLELDSLDGETMTIKVEQIISLSGEGDKYKVFVIKEGGNKLLFDFVVGSDMDNDRQFEYDGIGVCEVRVRNYDLYIYDISGEGLQYKERSRDSQEIEELDETRPDTVRIHEDQHQFNKLFQPIEQESSLHDMVREVVEQQLPAAEAINRLITGVVRQKRRFMGVDSRARDEILAFYQDGRATEAIFTILSTNEIYNYRERFKELMELIPHQVEDTLERQVQIFAIDESLQPVEIDPEEVERAIDKVFGEEYQRDLKKWIEALRTLEVKGYTKEEIVSLAYQEPAHRWVAMAKRVPEKV